MSPEEKNALSRLEDNLQRLGKTILRQRSEIKELEELLRDKDAHIEQLKSSITRLEGENKRLRLGKALSSEEKEHALLLDESLGEIIKEVEQLMSELRAQEIKIALPK